MIKYYQPMMSEHFDEIISRYSQIEFFQPSPSHAPWHIQARIGKDADGSEVVLDFWPHKMKAARFPSKAVIGKSETRALIEDAMKDAGLTFFTIETRK